MLTLIIIAASALLSLATCESVELEFLYSVYRYGRPTERDSCFMCTVCGARLQWSVNNNPKKGFMSSDVVGAAYSSDDSQGSQAGQNIEYVGILIDKFVNEADELCLTSLLLVHQPQLSIVECRARTQQQEITEFNISSIHRSERNRNVKVDYIFSDELVFAGMLTKYMHAFLCEVDGGESLSVDVNGVRVQSFTAQSSLGTDMLRESHDTDVFSDAIVVSKRSLPEHSLTVLLLVFMNNSEAGFSVACHAGEGLDTVILNIPEPEPVSGQPSVAIKDSNGITPKSSDGVPTTSTANIEGISNSSNGTISNKSNKASGLKTFAIAGGVVLCIIAIISVVLAPFLLFFLFKYRQRMKLKAKHEEENKNVVDGPTHKKISSFPATYDRNSKPGLRERIKSYMNS